MAKPGKKPNAVPTQRWDLYIPSDLAAAVELLLTDPVRARVKYGARSELIEGLLRRWLNDKVANRTVRVGFNPEHIGILFQNRVDFHVYSDGNMEIPRKWAETFGLALPQQST
jgi:hypothetical protein